MSSSRAQKQWWLDWAVASRPISGERVSGDLHVVRPFDHGALIAVVDGVGHGNEATGAAQTATTVLNENPCGSVIALVQRCHQLLLKSRGVVMTIASLNALENTITWLGVGNVEGRLVRADTEASQPQESVLLRSGLVGYQLPVLYASVIPVATGDILIFATDGIQPSFAENLNHDHAPQEMADDIMARYFKGNDDALVLVMRYRGGRHD